MHGMENVKLTNLLSLPEGSSRHCAPDLNFVFINVYVLLTKQTDFDIILLHCVPRGSKIRIMGATQTIPTEVLVAPYEYRDGTSHSCVRNCC